MNKQQNPPTPFNPAFINIPVYLRVYGKDDNNMGVSQVEVLLEALLAYKEKAQTFTESDDKDHILITIDEVRDTILGEIYYRLSDTSEILRTTKTGLSL